MTYHKSLHVPVAVLNEIFCIKSPSSQQAGAEDTLGFPALYEEFKYVVFKCLSPQSNKTNKLNSRARNTPIQCNRCSLELGRVILSFKFEFWLFAYCCLRPGLILWPKLAKNALCNLDWPGACCSPPASAFHVYQLQV